MKIMIFRIDERLIHGQIITSWLQYAEAEQILVINDQAAKDNLRQTLLKMTTPKDIKLQILTINEGQKLIKNDDNNLKTLLLVENAQDADKIIDNIKYLNSINVGNQNMKKGKIKILDNFWLYKEDIEAFKSLREKNIRCEFRTVPNDHSQDVFELIKKVVYKN